MEGNTRDRIKTSLRTETDTRRDWQDLTSSGRVADARTGVTALTRKRCLGKADCHSNVGDVGGTGSRRIPVFS